MAESPINPQQSVADPEQPGSEGDVTLPASFAQERLWFLHQLEPGSPLYNIPLAYDVAGALDISALEDSIRAIIRRHEALRTNLVAENGELLQLIHQDAEFAAEVVDLSTFPKPEQDDRAAALARAFIRKPFDLCREPLLRVLVLKCDEDSFQLVLNIHHSVFDGVSLGIFFRELAEIYAARIEGRQPSLPPLAIQYGDFADWQRQSLRGAPADRKVEFWRERLRDFPPDLDLPTDKQPARNPTTEGGDYFFALPDDLALALRELCRREGITLFMAFTAAFQALLFRYTGQERMLIGVPVSNRDREETEHLIGLFVNTVVLRGDFRGDPTVRELLRRVRDETLTAIEQGDLPFEKLVHELQIGRREARNPLFRTMIVLQDHSLIAGLPGLHLSPMAHQLNAATLDLLIEMIDDGTGLRGGVSYSTDLFEPATIQRLAEHFTMLLRGMVESPDRPVATLPLLTPHEQQQLLDWNRTGRDFPADETLAALFERCVAKNPAGIALIDGGHRLTYETLNRRANAVARGLHSSGVTRGSLVGVPAERSARFVIAVLGILKAGGACVPLDPAEPAERSRHMRSLCAHLIAWRTMPDGQELSPPPCAATSSTPAYVLFTSGSTGVPKGVMPDHRAIARLVIHSDFAAITNTDVFAFASHACFDAATFEIWGALLNGATLVVVPPEIILSPHEFGVFLAENRITTLFTTTSLFNQIAAVAPATFAGLRCLIFGGETADAHAVRQVLAHGKPERLLNAYGPTETTTFATCHLIERVESDRIPIGRPIANTTAHVLDASLNPVPIGIVGELHIGGPGLALGYLNDPALTAEKFIETGFGRLYRTGDLASWRADGTLEFRGRRDSQIKLRGFRIEPGEIETALQALADVRQAAVVARTQEDGGRFLVGYLVGHSRKRPDTAQLHAFLASRLPAHMIPRCFVWLDALPLTANGKLNHHELPLPSLEPAAHEAAPRQPRNPIEHGVADLWKQVLGRNGFSLHDDFFSLGGHSLLALRMLGEIRSKFGVEVPARRLFESPTVAGLALFIAEHLPSAESLAGGARHLLPIRRGDASRPPLFLVPGGWGGEIEFLVYAELSRHMDPGIPIWGLKARGAGTGEAPHTSVTEMAADYLREIRKLQPSGPYFIAGECVGGICAYEMACQLEEAGEELALLLLFDTTVPDSARVREYKRDESLKRVAEFWNHRVHGRVRHHLDKMAGLPFGEKAAYLLGKFTGRGTHAETEQGVPIVEQHPRGQKDYPVTLMRHQLRRYGGRVTLLLDEETSRLYGHLGWEKAPVGQLETHVLPGDHITYIRGEAQTAAAKVQELLHRASAQYLHDPATA
jgi:amino acid adenylation domain-containing protein